MDEVAWSREINLRRMAAAFTQPLTPRSPEALLRNGSRIVSVFHELACSALQAAVPPLICMSVTSSSSHSIGERSVTGRGGLTQRGITKKTKVTKYSVDSIEFVPTHPSSPLIFLDFLTSCEQGHPGLCLPLR